MPEIKLFGIDPKRALEILRKKGKKFYTDKEWKLLVNKSFDDAFTISKVMSADILQMFFELILKAKKEGWTLEEFQKQALPIAEKTGWTGNIKHRLKIIYKTNLDLAYAKGKYAQQKKLADAGLRPYLKYIASTSEEQNPFHKQFYGLVFRFDDPIWKIIYPPSRFGCECSTRSLSQKEVEEENITVSNGSKILINLLKNPEFKKEMALQKKSKLSIFNKMNVNDKTYNTKLASLLKIGLNKRNAKRTS